MERRPVIELNVIADLDRVLAEPGPLLLFKHSTACPISAAAHDEFAAWTSSAPATVRIARVLVIESRPVSNAIAERLGVRHQSPQAILVAGGVAMWNASHRAITRASLDAAVRSA